MQDTVLPDNLKEDVETDATVEPLPTSVDLLLEEQDATDKATDEEVAMAFGPINPSLSVIKPEMSRLLLRSKFPTLEVYQFHFLSILIPEMLLNLV